MFHFAYLDIHLFPQVHIYIHSYFYIYINNDALFLIVSPQTSIVPAVLKLEIDVSQNKGMGGQKGPIRSFERWRRFCGGKYIYFQKKFHFNFY